MIAVARKYPIILRLDLNIQKHIPCHLLENPDSFRCSPVEEQDNFVILPTHLSRATCWTCRYSFRRCATLFSQNYDSRLETAVIRVLLKLSIWGWTCNDSFSLWCCGIESKTFISRFPSVVSPNVWKSNRRYPPKKYPAALPKLPMIHLQNVRQY